MTFLKLLYYEGLTKSPANRDGFGEVSFYKKSGWKKLESSSMPEPERLKLLPAVKPVIEGGDYIGESRVAWTRKDGIVKFHYFEGNAGVGEDKKFLRISVGEDANGKKFYNLVEDSDLSLLNKAKARDTRVKSSPAPSKDSASGTLDESIAEESAEINIFVL